MRRIGMIGLVVLSVLGLSAVTSGTASAATCGEAGTLPCFVGPYPKPFTSTSGKGKLETVGKKTVTCEADTNDGEITGEKTDTVLVDFTGCKSSGVSCNTPKDNPGEILTVLLASTLGYINKAAKTVGILLAPKEGTFFVEFECTGFAKSKVTGSVIGELKPPTGKNFNEDILASEAYSLVFKQTLGVQAITKFEGGEEEFLKSSLNGGTAEQAGEETTDSITFSTLTEVKA